MQDNGVLVSDGETPYWQVLQGGDDGSFALILASGLMIWSVVPGGGVHWTDWGVEPRDRGLVSFDGSIPGDGSSALAVLQNLAMDVVSRPNAWFSDLTDVMFGVVGGLPRDANNNALGPPRIYGVFTPAFGGVQLVSVGSLYGEDAGLFDPTNPNSYRDTVTAVFSDDATSIFVGDASGNIFRFIGGASQSEPPALPTREIVAGVTQGGLIVTRFTATSDGTLFAAYNGGQLGPGFVLRRGPVGQWAPIDGSLFVGTGVHSICAVDSRVYVATTQTVYMWDNAAEVWWSLAPGLPSWARCSDINTCLDPVTGATVLYVSTFGRSVWQCVL